VRVTPPRAGLVLGLGTALCACLGTITVDAQQAPSYFVPPRSTGTLREPQPPPYVRDVDDIDWLDTGRGWLQLGLDYRVRYEYRSRDVRRSKAVLDTPVLLRTRAYVGVTHRFDPFRAYVEVEDARRYASQFPRDDRDINEAEVIQAVAELHLADTFGAGNPLRIQGGRMAFEYVDRRLLGRNAWRNTTNTFQGARVIVGEELGSWQVDVLALQPLERRLSAPDRPRRGQWLYGAVGDVRRWSRVATLQPFYLVLDRSGTPDVERQIHTIGLRTHGPAGRTGFDYDLQEIVQVGRSRGRTHRATATTAELGYTLDRTSRPRVSGFFGHASGDRQPDDRHDERFERLFGFARPWSANDYITFDNVIAPKARLEFQLAPSVRVDSGYGAFWLASGTDVWFNAALRDPTGQSGRFMGHEVDARVRLRAGDHTDVTIGYAHFIPGGFTRNQGKPLSTDFFYVEVAPRLFK
jgi:hypothetical protein